MNIASSLSPSAKQRLRPYWHTYKRVKADVDDTAEAVSVTTRVWLRKIVQRFKPIAIPAAANGRLNLHIGCGPVDHPQFVNIDGYPFPHVHLVQSIERLRRFRTESVDLIYASHCLEHVRIHQVVKVLAEWNRVLKKGGVLRLSVPDFDKLVDIYQQHGRDVDVIIGQLLGGQENRYNYHYTVLSEVNLTNALHTAGFSAVRGWQPGSEPLTTFADFSTFRLQVDGRAHEISLNLEAVK